MVDRAVIFGCEGPTLAPAEAAFFAQSNPWGFILFARNLIDADQIRRLCGALRDAVGRDAPILIDQEGGRVARLRAPLAREWPHPLDHIKGKTLKEAKTIFYWRYRLIAAELTDLGIDVNCAPMVDLIYENSHDIISDRAYGTDPNIVAGLGRSVADGLMDGGVLPILKHIPGHGRAAIDSHLDLPRIETDLKDLVETDFLPFKRLSDLPMAMTGHLLFEEIDAQDCVTHSKTLIGFIRANIGFDGLLMTDDLSMKALGGDLSDRASKALDAGCDMILHCNGQMPEMEAVADATPILADTALQRANAALASKRAAQPFDPEEARAAL